MTGKNLPPELEREIGKLKQRVTDLERKLSKRIPEIPGETIPFSYAGVVTEKESGRWVHPRGANLVLLIATVLLPDPDDPIVLEARRNGTKIGDSLTLEATGDFARTKIPTVPFGAEYDRLSIAVTSAPEAAEDLVVIAVFDG